MSKTHLFFIICLATFFCGVNVFAASAPTANAGPDLYVNSGLTITLQGSGYDPQGSSLTYYWNCSGGNLSSYNIAQPTYTAPSVSVQTTYNCTFTVTNAYGFSSTDTMLVYANDGSSVVQTNPAANILNNQATLNGQLLSNTSYNTQVWFQWGTTTNYGNQTNVQTLNNAGLFNQNIANLSTNTNYHFRAVAQTTSGTFYGQDMTFHTSGSGTSGSYLTVSKKVINLTSGNLNWQSSVNANQGDILSFVITMEAGGQDVRNVYVRDVLPSGLVYKDNMTINASIDYSGNPANGINVGTIPANGIEVISYQAQVAVGTYGTSALANNATITSTEAGTQTASASVFVTNSAVSGATYIPTGMTNNPFTDSFFFPVSLIILMSYLYFTGKVHAFADWLKTRI